MDNESLLSAHGSDSLKPLESSVQVQRSDRLSNLTKAEDLVNRMYDVRLSPYLKIFGPRSQERRFSLRRQEIITPSISSQRYRGWSSLVTISRTFRS
jgi:hypothetical protein